MSILKNQYGYKNISNIGVIICCMYLRSVFCVFVVHVHVQMMHLTCAGLWASSACVALVSSLSSLTPYLAQCLEEQQAVRTRDQEEGGEGDSQTWRHTNKCCCQRLWRSQPGIKQKTRQVVSMACGVPKLLFLIQNRHNSYCISSLSKLTCQSWKTHEIKDMKAKKKATGPEKNKEELREKIKNQEEFTCQ